MTDHQNAEIIHNTYNARSNASTLASKSISYILQISCIRGGWWIIRWCWLLAIGGVCIKKAMASAASLTRRLAASSWFFVVGRSTVAWAIVREHGGIFPSKILPTKWKTLADWMLDNDHSIVVNKGVYNILDAKVCTTSITRFWLVTRIEYVSPLWNSPPLLRLQTYNNPEWKN